MVLLTRTFPSATPRVSSRRDTLAEGFLYLSEDAGVNQSAEQLFCKQQLNIAFKAMQVTLTTGVALTIIPTPRIPGKTPVAPP